MSVAVEDFVVSSEEEYWMTVEDILSQVPLNYIEQVRKEPLGKTLDDIIGGMSEQLFPILSAILLSQDWELAEREFLLNLGELMFLSVAGDEDGINNLLGIFENLAVNASICSVILPDLLAWGMRWNALVIVVLENGDEE